MKKREGGDRTGQDRREGRRGKEREGGREEAELRREDEILSLGWKQPWAPVGGWVGAQGLWKKRTRGGWGGSRGFGGGRRRR